MNNDQHVSFKSFELLQGERLSPSQEPVIGLRIVDVNDSATVYPMTADEALELAQYLARGAALVYKQLGRLEDMRAQIQGRAVV